MKQIFTHKVWAVMLMLASSLTGFSQISENFNTRPGANSPAGVQSALTANGWTFLNSSVSGVGPIEGDQSVKTNSNIDLLTAQGVVTPLLVVGSEITVSFKFKFDGGTKGAKSYILELLNCNNQSVKVLTKNTTNDVPSTVTQTFTGLTPGNYKLSIRFQGEPVFIELPSFPFFTIETPNAKAVIDEVSVPNASLKYQNGVNSAPEGSDDTYTIVTGNTISGNVLGNDSDPDGDVLSASLVAGISPSQGTLVFNADGSFTYTAAPGFTGPGVAFTYKICDDACQPLCSDPVTVMINFPAGGITPVMMLDFTGSLSNSNVKLNWSTATEINNARFEIEKSEDNKTYTKIGEVAGHGTVTSIATYSFTDAAINSNASILYYRLKQVDIDGKFEYSKTIAVRLNNSGLKASVAPNPIQGQAQLSIQLERRSEIQIRLLDSFGKELARKTVQGEKGTNAYTLTETTTLGKGLYFIDVVTEGNERTMIKIIK